MGKRLEIIHHSTIAARAGMLTGREVNLVYKNGKSMHALIETIQERHLDVRDGLHRKHRVVITDLEEIILDRKTDF